MSAPVTDRPTADGPQGAAPDAAEVRLAPMRRRDLRAVLRIESRTSSTPWSLGLFLAETRRADRIYLVARAGGRVVGYAGMLLIGADGHVTTVAVDPDHQGGGVGTRLVLGLIREAAAQGIEAVTLEVRASNQPALALYRRFGFAPAGVRAAYYRDPVEDALVLWVHDVHLPPYAERLARIEAGLASPVVVDGLSGPVVAGPDPDEPEEGDRS